MDFVATNQSVWFMSHSAGGLPDAVHVGYCLGLVAIKYVPCQFVT